MKVNQALLDYYRCPDSYCDFGLLSASSGLRGYFRFGPDAVCYGTLSRGVPANDVSCQLQDSLDLADCSQSKCRLPFNPTEVVYNLRLERYVSFAGLEHRRIASWTRTAYYAIRPVLPVSVRSRLQRRALRGWDKVVFPNWPLDLSVERILQCQLKLAMTANGVSRLPFIWFWPNGFSACVILTHDVETRAGFDYCPFVMDAEDTFGIKSSFQIVPEKRYPVAMSALGDMRARGFEINVHDLNHDGDLYACHSRFLQRAKKINRYLRDYGAKGFRSAVLYRILDWYDTLDFSYDMSIRNVGNLDPQPGGCCTIMPYFIGSALELPLTTVQDYSLFYLLGEYSIDLWVRQIRLILKEHGLISFNIHPDYIQSPRANAVFHSLLDYSARTCEEQRVWKPLPWEVDLWWRARSRMNLVSRDGSWVIEGPDSEKACIAFALLEGDQLVYELPQGAAAPSV